MHVDKFPFQIDLPQHAIFVCERLVEYNFEAYVVGGFIRDCLLEKQTGDIDIATNAYPEQVTDIFSHTIPTGIKHGTVTVMQEGEPCEVTTYRTDGKYTDNRRPEKVSFSKTILEDLKRRDFTINAFAYHHEQKVIIDCFCGKKDLENKIIKTIGSAEERFSEDALRMLRACRFASQLDFKIEENVLKAIKKHAKNITTISVERIREEFIKILTSPKPSIGIEYLRKTNLLPLILPELHKTIGIIQNQYHGYDVYYHSLAVVDSLKDNYYPLRLSALLHDIGKPETQKLKQDSQTEYTFYNHENVGEKITKKILKRLKFSKKVSDFVRHLIKHHMFHYTENWSDAAVRRFINRVGEEMIPFLFKLRVADNLGKGIPLTVEPLEELVPFQKRLDVILAEKSALTLKELSINGDDLIKELNLAPSKKIGEILRSLLEEVIENPQLNSKEILLKMAKSISVK